MTNYRFILCRHHDKSQFNFCFDCGSPLIEIKLENEKLLTCKKNTYHVKLFLKPHDGDLENDECEIEVI